ncbi:YopX family protein [Campylobacter sp. RM16188]|uniref:YopX family protein n=1 Tax=Campylobacter sp. RM16188 TaxID=1705725 RepID=UPI001552FAF2|nr:YopX family protein [Campylobacter sp. RM16188]
MKKYRYMAFLRKNKTICEPLFLTKMSCPQGFYPVWEMDFKNNKCVLFNEAESAHFDISAKNVEILRNSQIKDINGKYIYSRNIVSFKQDDASYTGSVFYDKESAAFMIKSLKDNKTFELSDVYCVKVEKASWKNPIQREKLDRISYRAFLKRDTTAISTKTNERVIYKKGLYEVSYASFIENKYTLMDEERDETFEVLLKDIELLQYTGFRFSRRSKEICEGDVLKFESDQYLGYTLIGKVKYDTELAAFIILPDSNGEAGSRFFFFCDLLTKVKVIGSVYDDEYKHLKGQ